MAHGAPITAKAEPEGGLAVSIVFPQATTPPGGPAISSHVRQAADERSSSLPRSPTTSPETRQVSEHGEHRVESK
jgi:hypothetical protein